MSDRVGDWQLAASGREVWPLDPRAEDVSFRDIAPSLSLVCRYGGHAAHASTRSPSTRVAAGALVPERQAPTELAPLALLHDAAEAYHRRHGAAAQARSAAVL
jgi:hypothetical protein